MKTCIIQSVKPNPPAWIRACMRSVHAWCIAHGYEHRVVSDPAFMGVTQEFGDMGYTNVTRSDLGRLTFMHLCLLTGEYSEAYWMDADFVIPDEENFELPAVLPGHIVCAREVWRQNDGSTSLAYNNSVIGLCDAKDAHQMIMMSLLILHQHSHHARSVRQTVIGTDLFSSRRLPLRRIVAKQAACLSPESIRVIVNEPLLGMLNHLFWLSVAHGATVRGANLCSSQKNDDVVMMGLVVALRCVQPLELRGFVLLTPFYRAWLHVANLPNKVRCWVLSRWQEFRRVRSAIP